MEKLKKERYRKIRGLILYVLVKAYPAPMDHYEIRCFLDDLRYTISEEELKFHLAYLEEAKCIEPRAVERAGMSRQMVKATREGINVNDGRVEDIGIEVRGIP